MKKRRLDHASTVLPGPLGAAGRIKARKSNVPISRQRGHVGIELRGPLPCRRRYSGWMELGSRLLDTLIGFARASYGVVRVELVTFGVDAGALSD